MKDRKRGMGEGGQGRERQKEKEKNHTERLLVDQSQDWSLFSPGGLGIFLVFQWYEAGWFPLIWGWLA